MIKKHIWHFLLLCAGTILLGTLLHFTYEWFAKSPIVGAFSAVNESTFEHLKLLITPMVLFGVIGWLRHRHSFENIFPALFFSILIGMLTITAFFYTYTGIIGTNFMVLDIFSFILGVFVSYFVLFRIIESERFTSSSANVFAAIGVFAIVAAMVFFTFYPPQIALFKDPMTGAFGI